MNIKKSIFLFLALLLPIVIFLFLKFFGKNEFTVEPLFQTTVQVSEGCSGVVYKTPYTIADSILSKLQISDNDSATIVVFQEGWSNRQEQAIQLTRILKEFASDPMHVIKLEVDSVVNKENQKFTTLQIEKREFTTIRNCIFLMSTLTDAVVIDNRKRIRGQYVLSNREDADRLILELKILLKKY